MTLLAALPLCAGAQVEVDTLAVDSMVVVTDEGHEPRPVLRFGYVSYETALKAMPDYATASKRLAELKAKYDDEARRVADEFNAKYEEFLDGQAGYPATICTRGRASCRSCSSATWRSGRRAAVSSSRPRKTSSPRSTGGCARPYAPWGAKTATPS